ISCWRRSIARCLPLRRIVLRWSVWLLRVTWRRWVGLWWVSGRRITWRRVPAQVRPVSHAGAHAHARRHAGASKTGTRAVSALGKPLTHTHHRLSLGVLLVAIHVHLIHITLLVHEVEIPLHTLLSNFRLFLSNRYLGSARGLASVNDGLLVLVNARLIL